MQTRNLKTYKYVHIINNDKFIRPFIDFIEKYFVMDEHLFLFLDDNRDNIFPIPKKENIFKVPFVYTKIYNTILLSKYINGYIQKADKIFIHGLFQKVTLRFLFFNQKKLSNYFWIVWGGDLYSYQRLKKKPYKYYEIVMKKKVISKLGGIICYNKEEYDLVKEWYGAEGKFLQSFFYTSNVCQCFDTPYVPSGKILNIQIGNSADPSNNHYEILDKLKPFKDQDIHIYAPLSYGNEKYAEKLISYAKKIFGHKFIPIVDYMTLEDYLMFLSKINIAIFAHDRQQAMGNIINLLCQGKTVYLRNTVTPWSLFKDIGIEVLDFNHFLLRELTKQTSQNNSKQAQNYFSENNLVQQWKEILK